MNPRARSGAMDTTRGSRLDSRLDTRRVGRYREGATRRQPTPEMQNLSRPLLPRRQPKIPQMQQSRNPPPSRRLRVLRRRLSHPHLCQVPRASAPPSSASRLARYWPRPLARERHRLRPPPPPWSRLRPLQRCRGCHFLRWMMTRAACPRKRSPGHFIAYRRMRRTGRSRQCGPRSVTSRGF